MQSQEILAIAQELKDLGDEVSYDALRLELNQTLQNELYLAAQEFYIVLDKLEAQITDLQILLKRQKQLRRQNRQNFQQMEEYIDLKERIAMKLHQETFVQEYIRAHFLFQEKVNAVLGQIIQMVFVYDDGNGPELYDLMAHDLLTYEASSSAQISARYPSNVKNLTRLQSLTNVEWKFSIQGLKQTYAEVISRFQISKQYIKKGSPRVFYKTNLHKWHSFKVSSEGDINEAYARFILINDSHPPFTKTEELNVQDYLFYGVKSVDNISGLLQGDVSVGNIEYGIKSAGASILGLKQVRVLAKTIISQRGNFTITDLQNYKQQLAAKGRQRNREDEYVSDTLDDLLSEFDKYNKK